MALLFHGIYGIWFASGICADSMKSVVVKKKKTLQSILRFVGIRIYNNKTHTRINDIKFRAERNKWICFCGNSKNISDPRTDRVYYRF